ncbi:MAG: beta-N-acetylhexosaminidase [Alphaproteobacteria bacterium]
MVKSIEHSAAIIYGLSGLTLTPDERSFFTECNPYGFILFKRNCDTPEQIRALTNALRDLLGRDCPILIDQEGGRVQRMNAPNWRAYPPARLFGEMAEQQTLDKALTDLRFNTLQMIEDLQACGITVNCTPVADILIPEAHDVIGDRAFSEDPAITARLALSVCRHYVQCAMNPIMKHIPGHGRALADSHLELPVVDTPQDVLERTDFVPFREIARSDVGHAVWAMTAHVIYSALDKAYPATISPHIIGEIIRKSMGFEGVLVSDDLDMKALSRYGSPADMALASLEAGCDLALHCSGNLQDMLKIAEKLPKISEISRKRLQKSLEFRKLAA